MTEDIKKVLKIVVKTPDGTLFDGEAESITTKNKNGVLDILPLHENFISRIEESVIVRPLGSPHKEFKIQTGILKVNSNAVEIFLGIESTF